MSALVSIDIGGTHARFAIAEVDDGRVVRLGPHKVYRTADHQDFQSAWESYCGSLAGDPPQDAAIAIASPVGDGPIRFTNNHWIIDRSHLRDHLNVQRHILINDFEAVALAVVSAAPEHFLHICGPQGDLPSTGTLSVVGPGTGLGVAHVHRSRDTHSVHASEGGHIAFAPLDPVEDAILERLRLKYGRVSVERVVSGPGIVEIYRSIAAAEPSIEPDLDAITIWSQGLFEEGTSASAAVERFCLILGSVAGDVALAQGGFAGVVIAGGLGYRIRETLLRSGFADRFSAKGRFTNLMASIPVKLITHPEPGLLGAAAAFATAFTGATAA